MAALETFDADYNEFGTSMVGGFYQDFLDNDFPTIPGPFDSGPFSDFDIGTPSSSQTTQSPFQQTLAVSDPTTAPFPAGQDFGEVNNLGDGMIDGFVVPEPAGDEIPGVGVNAERTGVAARETLPAQVHTPLLGHSSTSMDQTSLSSSDSQPPRENRLPGASFPAESDKQHAATVASRSQSQSARYVKALETGSPVRKCRSTNTSFYNHGVPSSEGFSRKITIKTPSASLSSARTSQNPARLSNSSSTADIVYGPIPLQEGPAPWLQGYDHHGVPHPSFDGQSVIKDPLDSYNASYHSEQATFGNPSISPHKDEALPNPNRYFQQSSIMAQLLDPIIAEDKYKTQAAYIAPTYSRNVMNQRAYQSRQSPTQQNDYLLDQRSQNRDVRPVATPRKSHKTITRSQPGNSGTTTFIISQDQRVVDIPQIASSTEPTSSYSCMEGPSGSSMLPLMPVQAYIDLTSPDQPQFPMHMPVTPWKGYKPTTSTVTKRKTDRQEPVTSKRQQMTPPNVAAMSPHAAGNIKKQISSSPSPLKRHTAGRPPHHSSPAISNQPIKQGTHIPPPQGQIVHINGEKWRRFTQILKTNNGCFPLGNGTMLKAGIDTIQRPDGSKQGVVKLFKHGGGECYGTFLSPVFNQQQQNHVGYDMASAPQMQMQMPQGQTSEIYNCGQSQSQQDMVGGMHRDVSQIQMPQTQFGHEQMQGQMGDMFKFDPTQMMPGDLFDGQMELGIDFAL